jgi:hypothetical protein
VPCNVPLDNVIAVGATDKQRMRWTQGAPNSAARVKGSNFGTATVDVGAPGERIVGAQSSRKGREGVETRCAISVPTLSVRLQLHQGLCSGCCQHAAHVVAARGSQCSGPRQGLKILALKTSMWVPRVSAL